jgi:hypothetical protein
MRPTYETDRAKEGNWRGLYLTADDWGMIKDLGVLDALRDRGDNAEKRRGMRRLGNKC